MKAPVHALWSLVAVACLALSPVARATSEDAFAWQRANQRLAAAQQPADFLAAAECYRAMANDGLRSGPLFYNLGTALLMGRQYREAAEALRRAERYAGSNEDTTRNLVLALAEGERQPRQALPWYRVPLFWHYRLPCAARAGVAAFAFSLLWIGLTLRLLRRRDWSGPVIFVALLLIVVFGSSVLTTLQAEHRADVRSAMVRTAPAAKPGAAAQAQGVRP